MDKDLDLNSTDVSWASESLKEFIKEMEEDISKKYDINICVQDDIKSE